MTDSLRLSVLDLLPVRTGQSSSEAIRASIALAQAAEASGIHRYWVAEHHNIPGVASTNPPVLIAILAAATKRMRIGSGGVMLPNHAPLDIAEQFALLEAAHPGRIDLGIGRAPGSDPVTNWALRLGGPAGGEIERFDEHVDNLIAMMEPEGVGLQLQGRTFPLRATPRARSASPVWLLGSSDYSARLAAAKGLPYVFAHHFAGEGTAEMLALYRSTFRPSDRAAEPTTFLTVNIAVAPTREEAERVARPQLLAMVALRTGQELGPQLLVEQAARAGLPEAHLAMLEALKTRWIIDAPAEAASRVRALADLFGVDEVMLHLVAGAYEDEPLDRTLAREETIRLLTAATRSDPVAG